MNNLVKDSNLAKYSKEVFLKDDVCTTNVVKIKSTKIPEYLEGFVNYDTENILVVEDGNLIYDSLTVPIENIYINDFETSKDEIPNQYISAYRKFDNLAENNQINEIIDKNNGGVSVFVTAGTNLRECITIFNCSTIENNIVHNSIIMEKDSTANIVVYNLNLSTSNYLMSAVDILLCEGSSLTYTEYNDLDNEFRAYTVNRIKTYNNTNLVLKNINTSCLTSLSDVFVDICGENSNVSVEELAAADNETILNNNIEVRHNAPNSNSNISNIALAKGSAQINFNNSSVIKKDMIKSNARQKTTGIMLSEDGKISANPFLFIDCFDVSASHGSSIGKFSDDDLFYLMSRGLTKDEAEQLIVFGVIKPFYDSLTSEIVKNKLAEAIDYKEGDLIE